MARFNTKTHVKKCWLRNANTGQLSHQWCSDTKGSVDPHTQTAGDPNKYTDMLHKWWQ